MIYIYIFQGFFQPIEEAWDENQDSEIRGLHGTSEHIKRVCVLATSWNIMFKSQTLHSWFARSITANSFLVNWLVWEEVERACGGHFLPDATHFLFRSSSKYLRVNEAFSVSERKHRKLQCFCAASDEVERKLWKWVCETLHARVDVSCELTKWPAKCIKDGRFTLLLKQFCSEL